MNLSRIARLFFALVIFFTMAGTGTAQNQWIDSILPPDHLLENLPWMGEDGKVESKGLFDFEDVRGIGQKDLILIYRQSVPVNELDKPHNQTLVVCFYDPKAQKYIKNFEDEGGTIQWVKLLTGPDKKGLVLILQRDDLKGNQILKGFAYLGGGMKQVLDAMAPQIFAKFTMGSEGPEIWCSSKELPKDRGDSEHVFSWDGVKSEYAEGKTSTTAGWTGTSISVPVTVAESKPAKVIESPAAGVAQTSHSSKNGWWEDPLDAQTASTKLNTELVPQYIKKGQIAILGQKAKALFTELQKKKVAGKDINNMRASYYAAVASTLLDMGNPKDAKYYLKIAFSFQSDNPDAVALKAKMR